MGDTEQEAAITFWGVRGSTPCANNENMEYGGNTTCMQVHIPNSEEVLILDSGTGIRNLGNHLTKRPGKIRGRIFITHAHWDHIQGFPFFKPIYGSRNHFEIHMPEQRNGDGCKDILSGHLTKTFFPVTLDMIDANLEYTTQPQERVAYRGYDIELMFARHTIKTAIYKIYVGGKQIVFCPDNELNPQDKDDAAFYDELRQFIRGVDVLVHDGQYDLESYRERRGWGHSAWEKVVDFASKSNVKHLFITHHDPDSDDQYLRRLDQELQDKHGDRFESIQLAKEGQHISFQNKKG